MPRRSCGPARAARQDRRAEPRSQVVLRAQGDDGQPQPFTEVGESFLLERIQRVEAGEDEPVGGVVDLAVGSAEGIGGLPSCPPLVLVYPALPDEAGVAREGERPLPSLLVEFDQV